MVETARVVNIYDKLKNKLDNSKILPNIIYKSEAMLRCLKRVMNLEKSKANVLIIGETGTGKENIAKLIHEQGPVKGKLIIFDCAACDKNFIIPSLFGHGKGAFTGAYKEKVGYFELANNSTIFLDEIGELHEEAQLRLLRIIQEGTYTRLGETESHHINVRIISATNKNLTERMKIGLFREDLYYRIAGYKIMIPPLRERSGDVMLLANYFSREKRISNEANKRLLEYNWPGNIRELETIIESAIINCDSDEILPEHLEICDMKSMDANLKKQTPTFKQSTYNFSASQKSANGDDDIEELFLRLEGAKEFKKKYPGIKLGKDTLEKAVNYGRVAQIMVHLRKADGDIKNAAKFMGTTIESLKSKIKILRKIGVDINNIEEGQYDSLINIGDNTVEVIDEIKRLYFKLIYTYCNGKCSKVMKIAGLNSNPQYYVLKKRYGMDVNPIDFRNEHENLPSTTIDDGSESEFGHLIKEKYKKEELEYQKIIKEKEDIIESLQKELIRIGNEHHEKVLTAETEFNRLVEKGKEEALEYEEKIKKKDDIIKGLKDENSRQQEDYNMKIEKMNEKISRNKEDRIKEGDELLTELIRYEEQIDVASKKLVDFEEKVGLLIKYTDELKETVDTLEHEIRKERKTNNKFREEIKNLKEENEKLKKKGFLKKMFL
jgi:DNA-binding NtrC family response regulator